MCQSQISDGQIAVARRDFESRERHISVPSLWGEQGLPGRSAAARFRNDETMQASGAQNLTSGKARVALHMLTAVETVEFQETDGGGRFSDGVHRFYRLLFTASIGSCVIGGRKGSEKIFRFS